MMKWKHRIRFARLLNATCSHDHFLHYTYARRETLLLKKIIGKIKNLNNNKKKQQQTTHEQWKFNDQNINSIRRMYTHGLSELNTTHSHKSAFGHVCLLPAIHFKHVIFFVAGVFIMKRERKMEEKKIGWTETIFRLRTVSWFRRCVHIRFIHNKIFGSSLLPCKMQNSMFFFAVICLGLGYRSYVS